MFFGLKQQKSKKIDFFCQKICIVNYFLLSLHKISEGMPKTQKEIGDFISSERVKKSWTIYRLSRNCGIPIRHIQKIEKGENDMRVSTLQKILNALELKMKIEKI